MPTLTLARTAYHGFNQKPPFIEVGYFKLVSADEVRKLVIIICVVLGENGCVFTKCKWWFGCPKLHPFWPGSSRKIG